MGSLVVLVYTCTTRKRPNIAVGPRNELRCSKDNKFDQKLFMLEYNFFLCDPMAYWIRCWSSEPNNLSLTPTKIATI
jgi:hypothetical protein